MLKKLTAMILVALACSVHAEDNVLLWWFDNPDIKELDGSTVKTGQLVGRGEAAGKDVNLLRISVTDTDGNKVYLNLGEDTWTDSEGEVHGGWTDGWGLPDYLDQWKAGPSMADLSGLNLRDTALVFAMEIGNATFDADDNIVAWTIMASGANTLEELIAGGHILAHELRYEGGFNWQAGMAVPEPSSGLLMLVGGALLALRRKRKGAKA